MFKGVIEAKHLLKTGRAATVNDAVKLAGINRSAFINTRIGYFPLQRYRGKIITISLVLEDAPGVLSGILNMIANANGNVLTINQNIPIHGIAYVTISIDTNDMGDGEGTLIQAIRDSEGVQKIEVLAQE